MGRKTEITINRWSWCCKRANVDLNRGDMEIKIHGNNVEIKKGGDMEIKIHGGSVQINEGKEIKKGGSVGTKKDYVVLGGQATTLVRGYIYSIDTTCPG